MTFLLIIRKLKIALAQRKPDAGSVTSRLAKVASIAQAASDWMQDDSLLSLLVNSSVSHEQLAQLLVAHRFPLALAERPLKSLSLGERIRAALIVIFARTPTVELLDIFPIKARNTLLSMS